MNGNLGIVGTISKENRYNVDTFNIDTFYEG